MATLMDIYGKHYHMETWHTNARTARENEKLQSATLDSKIAQMRTVMLDESDELVTTPIDMGSFLYVPQDDGTWRVTYLTADRQNETRALDARAKGPMGV